MKANPIALLRREFRRSPEGRYTHRLHAVLLALNGLSCVRVGELMGESPRTVAHWFSQFKRRGLSGLRDAAKSGRPTVLTGSQTRSLARALGMPPGKAGLVGKRWSGKLVSEFLRERFGVPLTVRHCRRLLKEHEQAVKVRAM